MNEKEIKTQLRKKNVALLSALFVMAFLFLVITVVRLGFSS